MGTTYADALGDLDAAIDRLRLARSADEAEQRRALNEAMGCVYRLRNRVQLLVADLDRYYSMADQHVLARVVEAIVLVRGAGEHDFLRDVEPCARFAYLGSRTFPSSNLFADDRNLYWRARSDLAYDLTARDRRHGPSLAQFYDDHLAGYLVLDTLHAARSFFESSTSDGGGSLEGWWRLLPG